ncbi:MAG: hypothetical protein RIM23_08440 [Coleofasciculus sp. G3-WIS-01]|uniref:hypothetical protein n=1 Tax=Coleofasciculus sp. G3-WIS-01 TaxID=3069528 RepID=UPI003302657E
MGFSNFKLADVVEKFDLKVNRESYLFAEIPEVAKSENLDFFLKNYLPLAIDINTEKARSEMIIAPILLELTQKTQPKISIFSGKDLTVDPSQDLNGECDFIISLSPEQLFITAPIITLVEAKKEDIIGGLGQCAAQMLGAQIFNQQKENQISSVYGAVTTGTVWRFLRLSDRLLNIDNKEYYISEICKILGILHWIISSEIEKSDRPSNSD